MKLSFIEKHIEKIRQEETVQRFIPNTPISSLKNVLTWITNSYVHKTLGGSEYMAHVINKFLIQKGYRINVIGPWDGTEFEGVHLVNIRDSPGVKQAVGECVALIAQNYTYPALAAKLGGKLQKPVVVFTHTTIPEWDPPPDTYQHDSSNLHIIYNTEWVRSHFRSSLNSIVVRPPIDTTKIAHQTTRKYVTLVSVSLNKGAYPFFEIATRMPDVQFLGVNNIIKGPDLPNITYLEKTRSIKEIYEQSDIVLMPSEYESWGMVASEAIASGVPVIASPTPGLQENLAYAGLYIHQNAIEEWVSMIRKLKNDTEFYAGTVVKCLQRAEELKAQNTLDFDRMKTFIDDIVR